jgi:hypothetical protein
MLNVGGDQGSFEHYFPNPRAYRERNYVGYQYYCAYSCNKETEWLRVENNKHDSKKQTSSCIVQTLRQ